MNPLQQILEIIQLGAAAAAQLGPLNQDVATGGAIAGQLVEIVRRAAAAHQAVAGKPMDLSLLEDIPLLED